MDAFCGEPASPLDHSVPDLSQCFQSAIAVVPSVLMVFIAAWRWLRHACACEPSPLSGADSQAGSNLVWVCFLVLAACPLGNVIRLGSEGTTIPFQMLSLALVAGCLSAASLVVWFNGGGWVVRAFFVCQGLVFVKLLESVFLRYAYSGGQDADMVGCATLVLQLIAAVAGSVYVRTESSLGSSYAPLLQDEEGGITAPFSWGGAWLSTVKKTSPTTSTTRKPRRWRKQPETVIVTESSQPPSAPSTTRTSSPSTSNSNSSGKSDYSDDNAQEVEESTQTPIPIAGALRNKAKTKLDLEIDMILKHARQKKVMLLEMLKGPMSETQRRSAQAQITNFKRVIETFSTSIAEFEREIDNAASLASQLKEKLAQKSLPAHERVSLQSQLEYTHLLVKRLSSQMEEQMVFRAARA